MPAFCHSNASSIDGASEGLAPFSAQLPGLCPGLSKAGSLRMGPVYTEACGPEREQSALMLQALAFSPSVFVVWSCAVGGWGGGCWSCTGPAEEARLCSYCPGPGQDTLLSLGYSFPWTCSFSWAHTGSPCWNGLAIPRELRRLRRKQVLKGETHTVRCGLLFLRILWKGLKSRCEGLHPWASPSSPTKAACLCVLPPFKTVCAVNYLWIFLHSVGLPSLASIFWPNSVFLYGSGVMNT